MIVQIINEEKMIEFGKKIGPLLKGGEIIELVGDVGAGKTTLVKGIAKGLGINDYIQSPSFTINRIYECQNGLKLSHYDYYRLPDAGLMADELSETMSDPNTITIIEWAGVVSGLLPQDRLTINIKPVSENSRQIEISAGGKVSKDLLNKL